MQPEHPVFAGEDPTYKAPHLTFGDFTLVYDTTEDELLLQIEGLHPLPVGTRIELRDPEAEAMVTGLRVRTLFESGKAQHCLDVETPPEWWAKRRAESTAREDERKFREGFTQAVEEGG